MVTGTGYRSVEGYIRFSAGFQSSPKVTTSLDRIDADKNNNLRIDCSAKDVTRSGFTISIITWADSKIYGAACSWIAHGN